MLEKRPYYRSVVCNSVIHHEIEVPLLYVISILSLFEERVLSTVRYGFGHEKKVGL